MQMNNPKHNRSTQLLNLSLTKDAGMQKQTDTTSVNKNDGVDEVVSGWRGVLSLQQSNPILGADRGQDVAQGYRVRAIFLLQII